jgi:hypothetical protein
MKAGGLTLQRPIPKPKSQTMLKDTPYVQRKKSDKESTDLYRPRLGKTFSQPALSRKQTPKMSNVILELDRNREELLRQNAYMRNL